MTHAIGRRVRLLAKFTCGIWHVVMVALLENMLRPSNRLALGRTKTDQHGIWQLEIIFAHGREETAALADARREATEMMTAGCCSDWISAAWAALRSTRWAVPA